MRLLCFLFSVVALHSTVEATAGTARRSTVNGTSATILTPDFIQYVQEIADSEGIPGLTLAVVSKTGPAEFGAWGIKSENGTKMTTDVRRTFVGRLECTDGFMNYYVPYRHCSTLHPAQRPSSQRPWGS